MKEVKTQEYQVWRDHVTKEIIRKEPTRTCLISPIDIESMNKQMYCNSIHGGAEYYFEEIIELKETPTNPTDDGYKYKGWRDIDTGELHPALPENIEEMTRNELLSYAKENGIEVSVRDKKEDILNQIKESC